MNTETNQNDAPATGAGEGGGESKVETVTIPKTEWETTNQTLGSLKRQVKDLSKPKDEPKETPKETTPDNTGLLKKAFLRSAGLKPTEIDFALETAEKWNMDVDKLVDDEDWSAKLEKFRVKESTALAVSGVKGGGGDGSQAKNSTEYWKAKGTPPTPDEVPDKKIRRKIVKEMMDSGNKKGTSFYNE